MDWMVWGLNPVRGMRYFLFYGPLSLLFIGCQFSFSWVEQPGCSVDMRPSTRTAEIRNEWSCASAPVCAFMVWTGKNLLCHSMGLINH